MYYYAVLLQENFIQLIGTFSTAIIEPVYVYQNAF